MKFFHRFGPTALLAVLTLILTASGCTTGRVSLPEDPSLGWYPTRIETELTGEDPLEGFNRTMFAVNHGVMEYAARPVGCVYTTIMPRPAIEAIERLCVHVEFPARLISNLGSAEWTGAWDETCRFFINSTVGICGLFDPAGNWFQIYSTESDFGRMFATWGIGPGCTFILPLCRSTNVRDTVGLIFDSAFDAKTYLPYTYLAWLNRMIVTEDAYASVVEGSADRYKTYRMMTALYREMQLGRQPYRMKNQRAKELNLMDFNKGLYFGKTFGHTAAPKPGWVRGHWNALPEFHPVSPARDTLRALLTSAQKTNDFWYMRLSLFNSDFVGKMQVRAIDCGPDLEKARYAFYPAPEVEEGQAVPPEKLVFLIPGIDGSFDAKSTTAVAELYQRHGYSVVAVDSIFHWRHVLTAGRGDLPGYVPRDAAKMRVFLQQILSDLKREGLVKAPVHTVLAGWSFGALTSAHIAFYEQAKPSLSLDRVVLIDPPADLDHAMTVMEDYLRNSAKISAAELREKLPDTVCELMSAAANPMKELQRNNRAAGLINHLYAPRIDEDISKLLVSFAIHGVVRDVLFRTHEKKPFANLRNDTGWSNRNRLYDELDRLTFPRYAQEFLIPSMKSNEKMDYPLLVRQAGLYPLHDFLAASKKVYMLHNIDDFLLSGADRKWVDSTFGDRMEWFDAGGHLGNFYLAAWRAKLIAVSEPETKAK